jgi:hypothetical protein
MTRIAYFDCIAGASGDMILGALLDAGLPEAKLHERLAALKLRGLELHRRRVQKKGFSATQVDVFITDDAEERYLAEIEQIVEESDLPPSIKEKAKLVFGRLCQVEADIHGTSPDRVHLHELGGVDTIVDVVGALSGLEDLGIERVYASPLPLGRGFVRGAHGQIPLPAPATAALLKGVPVVGSELEVELVTPTGAALLVSEAIAFGPIPPMTLTAIGYGAGTRDLSIPNILRLLVGEQASSGGTVTETLTVLETNIDDLNPEIYDYVMERLLKAGALDVSLSPIQMKKNRPGTLLSLICRPPDADALTAILFTETSTLGVRQHGVVRHALPRSILRVPTPYGDVRVKTASFAGRFKVAPEYEDCRRLAESHNVPLHEIYRASVRAAEQALV